MASFKSHPFFYTSLLLAGALTAGQAWLLFSQRSAAKRVSAEIEEKKQTLSAFSSQSPFPSRENLALVESDRLAVEKTRNDIRSALRATGEVADRIASAVVPTSPTDAYFDIANYVERIRSQARAANVSFLPENRFGFAAYISTGPERGLIEQVFQQRQYAEYLIGALLTSANPPKEFTSLLRERPLTAEQKTQIAEAIASGQGAPSFGDAGGDFFVMDPRTSARVPGFVETIPFRLTFVGNTGVLRNFLNELALFKVPVVVRSVEVESLGIGGQGATQTTQSSVNNAAQFGTLSDSGAPAPVVKPLVEQVDSRFIVTVEIVSLVDKSAPSEAPSESVPEATP
jgi:hypothetical protein